MSHKVNDIILEQLADEFYDDPKAAKQWLENTCNVHTGGLHEDELLDLFVQYSMDMMQDGYL